MDKGLSIFPCRFTTPFLLLYDTPACYEVASLDNAQWQRGEMQKAHGKIKDMQGHTHAAGDICVECVSEGNMSL